ncbi:MAG TPA: LysE family translocator [Bacteroidia bacterium]|nr:LysE family translocator [Bacteroidia bacterium]HNP98502.1 LysE family translocator [Bacteroidia bacterium]
MLEPVFSGFTFGLLLAIMLGPVFFALLQTSLHEGFKAGVHMALGVCISDATVIAICYFFAAQLNLMEQNKSVMGWIGGCLLIGFGIVNFIKKTKVKEVDDDKKTVHAKFMLQGFLLNILNPAVLLFWLSVIGIVSLKENYTKNDQIAFFGSVLLTVLGTDLLKSFVANRIKNLLKQNVIVWVNRVIGCALIGFGIHMIWKVI